MLFYEVDVNDWVKTVIADNAQVNIKLSKLLKVPHISCQNHLLALDLKDSVAADQELNSLMDSVCDGMISIKNSLKNTALLCKFTDLKVKTSCKTRWSSKFEMMQRFGKLYDELRLLSRVTGRHF